MTHEVPRLRVGMIGYGFMGAAHSQGWRVAPRFFDLPARAEMDLLVGRHTSAVQAAAEEVGLGGDRLRLAGSHRTRRHRRDRHRHAGRLARRDRHRSARGRQARAVREAARQHRRRGRRDGGAAASAPRAAASLRWSVSPTGECRRSHSPATWSPPARSARSGRCVPPTCRTGSSIPRCRSPGGCRRSGPAPARLATSAPTPSTSPSSSPGRSSRAVSGIARDDRHGAPGPGRALGARRHGRQPSAARSPSMTSRCSPDASTSGALGSFEATRFAPAARTR